MLNISSKTKDSAILTADAILRFVMNMILVCPDCYRYKIYGSINHTDSCLIGRFMKLLDEIVLDIRNQI